MNNTAVTNKTSSKTSPARPRCAGCEGEATTSHDYTKNSYEIHRCSSCGLKFVSPQPSDEELKRIYDSSYFQRGNKYFDKDTSEAAVRTRRNDVQKLELVIKHKETGALLDLGCAMGGFLDVAQDSGFEVTGLELSDFSAKHTEKELGCKVYNCDLLQANIPSNSFDVITMWDVIEHLKNPEETLKEIERILKPGGYLFATTGDIGSLYAKITGRYWHLMTPPQHLFFFTRPSLTKMLGRAKLNVKEFVYPGKRASISFILFKARETFGIFVSPLQKLAEMTGLGKKGLYVNIRDIMTCVAQKPE